jgi:hypothetical protein
MLRRGDKPRKPRPDEAAIVPYMIGGEVEPQYQIDAPAGCLSPSESITLAAPGSDGQPKMLDCRAPVLVADGRGRELAVAVMRQQGLDIRLVQQPRESTATQLGDAGAARCRLAEQEYAVAVRVVIEIIPFLIPK